MAEPYWQGVLGDRLTPISRLLWDDGFDNSLASATVYFRMVAAAGHPTLAENTVKLNDVTTGVSIEPAKTFTADTTNGWYAANGHGYHKLIEARANGIEGLEAYVSSTTTLPTPLSASARYFVLREGTTQNYFKLGTAPGAAAIPPTAAGSGTHSIKLFGHVQYAPQTTWATDAPIGEYKSWFIVEIGGVKTRYPNDDYGFTVKICSIPAAA
jgi:hypothetical protein